MAGLVLVRQRPGKGNAIFLTLEDDKGIANIIVWQRDFERLLPVIMSSKFVRVTGKLQSESNVVHIVAETIEDLTPWLSALLEEVSVPTGESSLVRQGDRGSAQARAFREKECARRASRR